MRLSGKGDGYAGRAGAGTMLLMALLLGSGAPIAAGGTRERLSWGPYEYLSRGYRNMPWSNDPFFPDTRAFTLMGIVSQEMAYINGKWYRLGDSIDGYEIKTIASDGVILTKKSELIRLKIKE